MSRVKAVNETQQRASDDPAKPRSSIDGNSEPSLKLWLLKVRVAKSYKCPTKVNVCALNEGVEWRAKGGRGGMGGGNKLKAPAARSCLRNTWRVRVTGSQRRCSPSTGLKHSDGA